MSIFSGVAGLFNRFLHYGSLDSRFSSISARQVGAIFAPLGFARSTDAFGSISAPDNYRHTFGMQVAASESATTIQLA